MSSCLSHAKATRLSQCVHLYIAQDKQSWLEQNYWQLAILGVSEPKFTLHPVRCELLTGSYAKLGWNWCSCQHFVTEAFSS
jgi:hypothetical protein